MDEKDLAEIEVRVAGATPGPWYPIVTDDRQFMTAEHVGLDLRGRRDPTGLYVDEGRESIRIDEDEIDSERVIAITCLQSPRVVFQDDSGGNAKFIAHARQDIPALIAEIRRLQALLTH